MKKTLIIYLILALIFVAGFATHGSDHPEIFIYSKKYFMVLVVMAIIMLGIIPYFLNKYLQKNGSKKLFSAMVPSLVTIGLIYVAGHYYYYAQQEHLFDPFLQMPPNAYEFSEATDSTTFRVLCIGGSTTRNVRLDTMDRYPSVLHKILNDKFPSRKVEVLNAGMDWYTSRHTNINYNLYCRDFKPDVIVLMHAVNDLYRSFSPKSLAVGEYKSDYTHFYGPSIAGAQPPSFEGFMGKIVRKFWFAPKYEPASFDISQFKSLPDFEKNMTTLVDIFQKDGAEVILVSQPYIYKAEMSPEEERVLWMDRGMCLIDGKYPNGETMAMAMDAYNAKTAMVAGRSNMKFVHGETALPKDLEHFSDDVHYTKLGAQKLAQTISDAIIID